MKRPILIVLSVLLCVGLGLMAYRYLTKDQPNSLAAPRLMASNNKQSSAGAGERSKLQAQLTIEQQHLQVLEIELAQAQASLRRSKQRLSAMDQRPEMTSDSLDIASAREKLNADRALVGRLKVELASQRTLVEQLSSRL